MPRRHVIGQRKFCRIRSSDQNCWLNLSNILMVDGKKSAAESIVYSALETWLSVLVKSELGSFRSRSQKRSPDAVEVKSRRVGGSTYQVPVEVRPVRHVLYSNALDREAARKRGDKSMALRTANELSDAAKQRYCS